MNEQTAREKMLREQRIREDARAAGLAEGWGKGRARAEEFYSPRITELERRVKVLEELISKELTQVAPMIRRPNSSGAAETDTQARPR